MKIYLKQKKSQLFGQTLHKFKTAHRKALAETKLSLPVVGWSGGAMVLGKLPVPGRPTCMD